MNQRILKIWQISWIVRVQEQSILKWMFEIAESTCILGNRLQGRGIVCELRNSGIVQKHVGIEKMSCVREIGWIVKIWVILRNCLNLMDSRINCMEVSCQNWRLHLISGGSRIERDQCGGELKKLVCICAACSCCLVYILGDRFKVRGRASIMVCDHSTYPRDRSC